MNQNTENKYKDVLLKYWGYQSFRPLQEDIIRSVGDDKKDTLGLLPTGGGKSVIFQVPALAVDGICLVITPLIALMKDQVENLRANGIRAAAVYSGMGAGEIDLVLNNCIFNGYKFLYLSPERLQTDVFRARVVQMNVNLVAVDEAHCISQWGYDFRPSYLKISELRKLLPGVPILAVTATATPEVVNDIQDKLLFVQKNVFKKSFERKNLVYIVRHTDDKMNYLLKILRKTNGTGVVYVRNRKRTREIADFLVANGISADYFHAGLKNEMKDYKQIQWKKGVCKIIVSTNAFGMGIDKPDVRVVVHMDLPDSLEAYFQEAGRAGRDEKTAFAVLLYNQDDKTKLERSLAAAFPDREVIKRVYNAIFNYYQVPVGAGKGSVMDFLLSDFAKNYNFDLLTIHNSLRLLQMEGYIELTEELNNPSRLKFTIDRQDLYKFQVSNVKFDSFIKLLLRTYTGLFTEYSKIDEDFLAKKVNSTRQVVYEYLVKLASMKIISFIPQKKNPQIIFTEPRLDTKSVFISPENYQIRKDRYTQKINAVLHYATSFSKCRSQLLLEYFGQTDAVRCGNCDVCKKRNELDLSRYEFDFIIEAIKEPLRLSPMTMDGIKALVPEKNETKVVSVLQWLIDNGKVALKNDNLFEWL